MKKNERGFLVKLYLGAAVMTMFCIWNANRPEQTINNIDNNMIVMNEK